MATDADVQGPLITGLRAHVPDLDLLLSNDFLPQGREDCEVLSWAANAGRVLLTFDRNTMTDATYNMIAVCMPEEEIADRVVVYLPFRG